MPRFPGRLESRLPGVGTTIFTVMSRLAQEHGAANLSQGFPDFAAPARLLERVSAHMAAGHNQYAPMAGAVALREAIAAKVERLYGRIYDVEQEITVTAGATQAIFTAVACCVRPGDEVIVFEPVYDSYVPSIRLAGGTPVAACLSFPDYRPDWQAVAGLLTSRTRMIIINTPHNPSGTLLDAADLDALAALVRGTDIVVVADEVYEHIVFDGLRHASCAAHPGLSERSFVISSFGKTYHVTGWKVAYCLAPRELMSEFRKAHQFIVFAVNTPVQLALAEFMEDTGWYAELAAFYEARRDAFRAAMAATRFELLPCHGTYFQSATYRRISDMRDTDFARWLTMEHGVAVIPVSAFFGDQTDHGVIRFCFAKSDKTLETALARLACV